MAAIDLGERVSQEFVGEVIKNNGRLRAKAKVLFSRELLVALDAEAELRDEALESIKLPLTEGMYDRMKERGHKPWLDLF